jgi:hypothetical protein
MNIVASNPYDIFRVWPNPMVLENRDKPELVLYARAHRSKVK